MSAIFKGLGRVSRVQVPTSPSPSPSLETALEFDELARLARAGVENYLATSCPGALDGAPDLGFAGMGRRAGAADLVEHMQNLEMEIDRLVLTKAEFDAIRDKVGRWEVTAKAIIHAIAVARTQNAELF